MPKARIRLTKAQMAKVRRSRLQRGFRALKGRPRIRKPLALKMHNFVERTNPLTMVVANETSAVGLFRDFKWSYCLQVANYARIFEYYRINKAVIEFRYKGATKPAYTSMPAGTSTTGTNNEIVNEVNPVLYFKVDHNDINADSLATMKESLRTREHQFTNNRPNFTITLKPAIQAEAYKTALSTAYRPKWGQWLSTGDDTVPHYGLKAYAVAGSTTSSANLGEIEVTTKIYFSAKCNE